MKGINMFFREKIKSFQIINFCTHLFRRVFNLIFRSLKNRKIRVLVVILVIIFLFFFINLAQQDRQQIFNKYHSQIRFVKKLIDNFYFWAKFFPYDIPRYELRITSRDLRELNDSRPPTYQGIDWTAEYPKISVPAVLSFTGKDYNVKVRYRGNNDTHWRDSQKSYYIQFEKNNLFFGQEAIHLVIPFDKDYYAEYVGNYRAKKFGLITNDGKFVNLKINGKDQGVYYEIQDWDKTFLEKAGKNSDSNLYTVRELENVFSQNDLKFKNLSYWKQFASEPYSNQENFADLKNLLDLINNPSDQYFYDNIGNILDLDNFYHWNAYNLITGNSHQDLVNTKLYFDSTLGKFQFVLWDVVFGTTASVDSELNYDKFVARILSNPAFLQKRNEIVAEYINNEDNLADDLAYFDEVFNQTKIDFYRDTNKFDTNREYREKVKKLRSEIIDSFQKAKDFLRVADVSVDIDLSNNQLVSFNVINTGFSSVLLENITVDFADQIKINQLELFADSNNNNVLDNQDNLLANLLLEDEKNNIYKVTGLGNIIFSKKEMVENKEGGYFEMKIVPNQKSYFLQNKDGNSARVEDIKLKIVNAFTKENINETIRYINNTFFSDLSLINQPLDSFLAKNPIFRKSYGNEVVILPGNYQVNKTIIVPQGLKLKIMAAVQLNFAPGVSLISYSPVTAIGTVDNSIVFTAQNKSNPWGVFGVVNTEKSIFDHTQFEYGGQAYINGIFYSGTLSLYRTESEITNSQFSYASGDDSLNIKNAFSIVRNNNFHDNSFDALDFDFADEKSIIENNNFFNNGNDGIDISGSPILIQDNKIRSSGDKCISIGEGSNANVINNLLKSCQIGVAVKDSSKSKIISNTIIENRESGVSVYQKKPIFGGAQPILEKNIIWGNKNQILIDEFSAVVATDNDIEGGWEGDNKNIPPEFNEDFRAKNLDLGFKE